MKLYRAVVIVLFLFILAAQAHAAPGSKIADQDMVNLLKGDIRDGKIQIGKTRLNKIKTLYGQPSKIKDSKAKLIYDYGGLKIEFDKNRYFVDWEYDYSYPTVYSDDIESLRFDIEDGQIVGDFYTFAQLENDYDKPTKSFETYEDGQLSIYHYGEMKLIFENNFVVRSWSGSDFDKVEETGVLGSTIDLTADKGVLETE